ncbi:Uncharacterized protein APZ42_020839 [Daphnia magna]|uniref:Uncharacterized protein n=1 Tax=Daphnia magna TaxID=35525 RepID=A0A164XFX5_9CRUS|nr:Uncharacterized protein APZ42_020839 [Daphnia magna]
MRFFVSMVLLVALCVVYLPGAFSTPAEYEEKAVMFDRDTLESLQEEIDKTPCDYKKFNLCTKGCFPKIPLPDCIKKCLKQC